jgi:hypothetical protein
MWKTITCLTLIALAVTAVAEEKEVELVQQWSGSIENRELLGKPPMIVSSKETWKALWKNWELEGETPDIDFSKRLVVVQTTVGGNLRLIVKLNNQGDLKVLGLATRDLRPGFRYALGVVSREGVKTVNGQEVSKDDDSKPHISGEVEGPVGELEAGLVVTIRLQDVSIADAAAKVLGEQVIRDPKAFPISFSVPYDPKQTAPGFRYGIGVRIEKDGQLKYINDTHIPVINEGPTKNVKAPVKKI